MTDTTHQFRVVVEYVLDYSPSQAGPAMAVVVKAIESVVAAHTDLPYTDSWVGTIKQARVVECVRIKP